MKNGEMKAVIKPHPDGATYQCEDFQIYLFARKEWNEHSLWRDTMQWGGPVTVDAIDRAING